VAGAVQYQTLRSVSDNHVLALKETAPAPRRTGAFFFPRGDARERRPFLIITKTGGGYDARTPGDSSDDGTTERGRPRPDSGDAAASLPTPEIGAACADKVIAFAELGHWRLRRQRNGCMVQVALVAAVAAISLSSRTRSPSERDP
jgi:hypothetical protein